MGRFWVPGNCRADELDKHGTTIGLSDEFLSVGVLGELTSS